MSAPPTTRPTVTATRTGRGGRGRRAVVDLTMAAGAGLVAWSAAIHLDLWHQGYRSVPTIGWLFLFQAVSGFAMAAVVLSTRRLWPALAGAVLLASTAGGLVFSVEWGLFGFRDSFGAPFAAESLGVEVAGAATLAIAALLRHRFVHGTAAPNGQRSRSRDARASSRP